MSLLSVKNLTVSYGDKVVVENVSFELNRRDILAVIGPNGSGKTTLMKAILALVPATGEIHWPEKTRCGYVPQRFDFDRTFPLTVAEAFLLRLGHNFWWRDVRSNQEIKAALEQVGALSLLDQRIGDLSGGQLQRVLIAYSLLGKPEILFFDEPATGIDLGGEETVYNLIHKLVHEAGLTVIFISHDLDVVYRHATAVICLNRKMVCHGAPRQVLTGEMLEQIYGQYVGAYQHQHKL